MEIQEKLDCNTSYQPEFQDQNYSKLQQLAFSYMLHPVTCCSCTVCTSFMLQRAAVQQLLVLFIHPYILKEMNFDITTNGNLEKKTCTCHLIADYSLFWEEHLLLTGTLSHFPSITLCSWSSSSRMVLIKAGQLHPLTTFTRRPP